MDDEYVSEEDDHEDCLESRRRRRREHLAGLRDDEKPDRRSIIPTEMNLGYNLVWQKRIERGNGGGQQ